MTLLIPVYNEKKYLEDVIRSIDGLCFNSTKIFVDDGSFDGSLEYLKSLKRKDFIIIPKNQNTGMGKALKTGFEYIAGQDDFSDDTLVITIDGDNQHDISMLPDYIKDYEKRNLDLLIIRRKMEKYPLYKRAGNRIVSKVTSLITGLKFNDIESGMRIMRKSHLRKLLIYFRGYRYSCAQEIAVIFAAERLSIANDIYCDIKHYRSNTSIMDFFINLGVGIFTFHKVRRILKRS